MTNDDDDLPSYKVLPPGSELAIVPPHVHFGSRYLTYTRRNGRSARNKCKFLWQASLRYLIVSEIRPRAFQAFAFLSILTAIPGGRSNLLSIFPRSGGKKGTRRRSLDGGGRFIGARDATDLFGNPADPRNDLATNGRSTPPRSQRLDLSH